MVKTVSQIDEIYSQFPMKMYVSVQRDSTERHFPNGSTDPPRIPSESIPGQQANVQMYLWTIQ